MSPDPLYMRARLRVDRLRRGAREAVRAPVPATVAIPVPGSAASQRRARAAIDLALRVAEAELSTSASAAEVVATALRILDAYGVHRCHVDVTYTAITASVYRGEDEDPLSLTRVVRGRGWDYAKLQLLHELVRAVTEQEMPLDAARARFDEIVAAPRIYRRSFGTLCTGLMGVSVALLFGGRPLLLLLAFVTGCLVDLVQQLMWRQRIAALFTQAATGVLPTTVAVGLYAAGADRRLHIDPSLLVVAGIVVALAGLGVVGAAQDAIDGFYVTAAGRSFEVVLMTTGVVVGIVSTLLVASELGVPMRISPYTAIEQNPLMQVACAAVVGVTFAVSSYTAPRAALLAGACAAGAWVVYMVLAAEGFGAVTSSAVAAVAVGVVSQLVARTVRVPAMCLSTASIISLLPGLAVYRGLWQLTQSPADPGPGINTLLTAFSTGLALAAGVSAGTFVARAWTTRGDLGLRAVLARATGSREVQERVRSKED